MRSLENAWYRGAGWLILLWPLSLAFQLFSALRRGYLRSVSRRHSSPLPVVVVGNLSVGGTGKTPFIIGLGKALQKAGLKPAVISRGYLGKAPDYPFLVQRDSPVEAAGDEALLIARALGCPMVVDPDRVRALAKVCKDFQCDVVLSDDGLQHYALPRDLEIAVVDGERLFGNGMCLPAGPLREPISRLRTVNYLVVNGELSRSDAPEEMARAYPMSLEPTYLLNLRSGSKKPFKGAPFNIGTTIHAVTGIGNPNRFFSLLSSLPYKVTRHDFPDHYPFTAEDFAELAIDERQPIVMTEKDAVKCETFAAPNFWYLAVEMKLPDAAMQQLVNDIKGLVTGRRTVTRGKAAAARPAHETRPAAGGKARNEAATGTKITTRTNTRVKHKVAPQGAASGRSEPVGKTEGGTSPGSTSSSRGVTGSVRKKRKVDTVEDATPRAGM